jgi:hypothetical protein
MAAARGPSVATAVEYTSGGGKVNRGTLEDWGKILLDLGWPGEYPAQSAEFCRKLEVRGGQW